MKVTRTGRSLELRGLPATVDGIKTPKKLGPLVISVMYEGDGNANKAIILDNYVIPIIVKALEHVGGEPRLQVVERVPLFEEDLEENR